MQPALHLFQDQPQILDIKLPMELVQDLDETAHVSAFEPVRQVDKHVEIRHSPLQLLGLIEHHDGIGDILDPHLLYINAAMVSLALDILHGRDRITMGGKKFYIIG